MTAPRAAVFAALVATLMVAGRAVCAPSDAQLPDAPGKAVVLQVCVMCHDTSEILRSPRKSVDDWDALILRMQSHGAEFTQEEELAVAAYLGKYFGPVQAGSPPSAPATAPAEPAKTDTPA